MYARGLELIKKILIKLIFFEKIYRFIEKKFSTFELTPFEKIICCALKFFDHQKVELLVLEAGLGGRLDATTAHKSRPIIAIGNIGLRYY